MIIIPNTTTWLGNIADLRDSRRMLSEGIDAIIDNFCNAGLSRSPCVAVAVISHVSAMSPNVALQTVSRTKATDVNPALWHQIVSVLRQMRPR